ALARRHVDPSTVAAVTQVPQTTKPSLARQEQRRRRASAMTGSRFDVVVIGAGPSGAIASALLKREGWNVLVIEAQRFPRFAVGESLLAHCLDFIQEAGMLEALQRHGFQYKDGAAFVRGEQQADVSFADRFSSGFDHAFQVDRASF